MHFCITTATFSIMFYLSYIENKTNVGMHAARCRYVILLSNCLPGPAHLNFHVTKHVLYIEMLFKDQGQAKMAPRISAIQLDGSSVASCSFVECLHHFSTSLFRFAIQIEENKKVIGPGMCADSLFSTCTQSNILLFPVGTLLQNTLQV